MGCRQKQKCIMPDCGNLNHQSKGKRSGSYTWFCTSHGNGYRRSERIEWQKKNLQLLYGHESKAKGRNHIPIKVSSETDKRISKCCGLPAVIDLKWGSSERCEGCGNLFVKKPVVGDPDYQSGHSINVDGSCNMGCC